MQHQQLIDGLDFQKLTGHSNRPSNNKVESHRAHTNEKEKQVTAEEFANLGPGVHHVVLDGNVNDLSSLGEVISTKSFKGKDGTIIKHTIIDGGFIDEEEGYSIDEDGKRINPEHLGTPSSSSKPQSQHPSFQKEVDQIHNTFQQSHKAIPMKHEQKHSHNSQKHAHDHHPKHVDHSGHNSRPRKPAHDHQSSHIDHSSHNSHQKNPTHDQHSSHIDHSSHNSHSKKQAHDQLLSHIKHSSHNSHTRKQAHNHHSTQVHNSHSSKSQKENSRPTKFKSSFSRDKHPTRPKFSSNNKGSDKKHRPKVHHAQPPVKKTSRPKHFNSANGYADFNSVKEESIFRAPQKFSSSFNKHGGSTGTVSHGTVSHGSFNIGLAEKHHQTKPKHKKLFHPHSFDKVHKKPSKKVKHPGVSFSSHNPFHTVKSSISADRSKSQSPPNYKFKAEPNHSTHSDKTKYEEIHTERHHNPKHASHNDHSRHVKVDRLKNQFSLNKPQQIQAFTGYKELEKHFSSNKKHQSSDGHFNHGTILYSGEFIPIPRHSQYSTDSVSRGSHGKSIDGYHPTPKSDDIYNNLHPPTIVRGAGLKLEDKATYHDSHTVSVVNSDFGDLATYYRVPGHSKKLAAFIDSYENKSRSFSSPHLKSRRTIHTSHPDTIKYVEGIRQNIHTPNLDKFKYVEGIHKSLASAKNVISTKPKRNPSKKYIIHTPENPFGIKSRG